MNVDSTVLAFAVAMAFAALVAAYALCGFLLRVVTTWAFNHTHRWLVRRRPATLNSPPRQESSTSPVHSGASARECRDGTNDDGA